jgi:hypothetical protein
MAEEADLHTFLMTVKAEMEPFELFGVPVVLFQVL